MKRIAVAFIACAGLGACASPKMSAETYSRPRAAIHAAEAVGAKEEPQAALHLRLAQEQVARADQLVAKGRIDEATRMLARANADAELASALAQNESTKDQVDVVKRRIIQLERSAP